MASLVINELHREEVESFYLANVIDPADIRMRDLPCDTHLIVEARKCRAIKSDGFGQEFEGDGLFQLEVFGFIDLSHAAATE